MDYVLKIMGPLLEGTGVTLQVFLITLVLSVPLGLCLALARISHFKVLSGIVNGYIWLMRGTPLMLQMLFIYFALPFVPVIGMTYAQTMRRIVLPQVVKRILPPISNETITLVKDTSLIYVLAMNDLLRAARGIVQRDFTTTPFVVAAAFYLVMTLVLTLAFQRLEKKYAVYDE